MRNGKPTVTAENLRQTGRNGSLRHVTVVGAADAAVTPLADYTLALGDVGDLLGALPNTPLFDLVVTSPPYNIGKPYEETQALDEYLNWQAGIIEQLIPRLKDTGSICWQLGNYVDSGHILPLDIEFAPLFKSHGLQLRNRVIWHFGHGLHTKRRFSGRYEVVLWYTKTEKYTFNLDAVRIPAKYPGKRHFKGPNAGKLSGNPLGKNPEDVWFIPNCKSNHVEKTLHPCQFRVGLIERLVLALTNPGDLVFDRFAGVTSTRVAAALHDRRFWGCGWCPIHSTRIQLWDDCRTNERYIPFTSCAV